MHKIKSMVRVYVGICLENIWCATSFWEVVELALCSPAGKGLTSWLSVVLVVFLSLSQMCTGPYTDQGMFVMSDCDFVKFQCGILGQVWYLIVLIPDLCRLAYLGR